MKPSERRALDAERRAREAAEWREKELEKQAKKQAKKNGTPPPPPKKQETADTERVNMDATYQKLPEKEIEVKGDGYHRESFFSNNARIIAFIVTTVVVLFVVGPLGYDIYLNIKDHQSSSSAVQGKAMTADDVVSLAKKGSGLTWDELAAYEHTGISDETIEISIEGTGIILQVERAKGNARPEIVRLIDYNGGRYINDIRKASSSEIKDFISPPENDLDDSADGEFDGKSLSTKTLLDLAAKGGELTWYDLEAYSRTCSAGGTVMEIRVTGTDFMLNVRRNNGKYYPIYVKLVHIPSGEYISDLQYMATDKIEEFIASHKTKN